MFEREELVQAMQEYGLNEKAALIYLVTLQIGSASAATIARLAHIKRVTTYAILQDLIRGGYIRELSKAGVKHFSAVPPEHLLTIKKQQYERFEALLPAFSTLMNEYTNRPRVEYFEGFGGLKEYYDNQIKE